MTPFETYKAYLALKRHFEPGSTYDYHKYNGQVTASPNSFEGRKDKLWFQKLAKHPDPVGLIVANLSHNPKMYVRNIAYDADSQKRYSERQKFVESMAYSVAAQCPTGDTKSFNELLKALPNEHPKLLKMYLAGKVRLETLVVLDDLTGFLKSWIKIIGTDQVAGEVIEKIQKMKLFLEYDKEMVRTAVLKKFQ